MKKIILLLIILFFGLSCSENKCEKYTEKYIPIDLTESLDYLDCNWTNELKETFKNKDEKWAGVEFGMSLRNGWKLWKGKNELTEYFNELGINHSDDITNIILTSFHRKLNNNDIQLEKQIEFYKEYWRKNKEQKQNGIIEKQNDGLNEEEPDF